MEEFNLNNPSNLNPNINDIHKGLTKEEQIDKWNSLPNVKEQNIKAIDTQKYKEVDKGLFKLIKLFAILGIISLIIIAISVSIWGYTIHKDGTLLNPIKLACGNSTLTCGDNVCPSLPELPDSICNVSCGSIPEELLVKLINNTE